MIKKDVTYEDLDGNTVTKAFYFNLSKADLAEMALTSEGNGGLADEIRTMQSTEHMPTILKSFKAVISAAVGVRIGDRFVRNDEIRSELMDTGAYGELFMEIATDARKAVEFIKGIIPQGVLAMAEKKIDEEGLTIEGWTPTERPVVTVEMPEMPHPDTVISVTTDLTGNIKGAIEEPGQPVKNITMYTRAQLMEMPKDEFYELAGRDASQWSKAVLSIAMARRAAEK